MDSMFDAEFKKFNLEQLTELNEKYSWIRDSEKGIVFGKIKYNSGEDNYFVDDSNKVLSLKIENLVSIIL
jgi:hypothetical protein